MTVTAYAVFYSSFAVPILAAGWLLTSNPLFTATSVATAATLVFLLIRVHDAIHFPGVSHLEKFRWFRFLDHHHYIHHIDNRANTNFLLPLGDFLMGTLRLELDAHEKAQWPSYEEARKLPAKAQRKADLMQSV
jgi:sterol desaturase/sphingolipid hydroxylase (fatty acid hydroxylase superfamily)